MVFVGKTRSLNRPHTDADPFSSAKTTDPESSAEVHPQQPVTGQNQEAQQAGVAPQPGPSNPVLETHSTVGQHAELPLQEAATSQSAGREYMQLVTPGTFQQVRGTVLLQPDPSQESERRVPIGLTEEEQVTLTWDRRQDPHHPGTQTFYPTFVVTAATGVVSMVQGTVHTATAELAQSARRGTVGVPTQSARRGTVDVPTQSARRGTVGVPTGQQPGFTVSVRPNPSQRAQTTIPTIEPGPPVQEVGGFGGYLAVPEEPDNHHQPLQDYIFVYASQPSKHFSLF